MCSYQGIPGDSAWVKVSTQVLPPDLTATPRIVNEGTCARLNWDTNNSNEALCSLTGGSVNYTTLPTVDGTAETGSICPVINAMTTFTLSCPSGNDSVTVEVIPIGFET